MAPASIRAMTGMPKRSAISAADGSPSNSPITPSIRIRSESVAARARRQRASASPHMPRSRFWQGRPLAPAWICGSRTSGPHLKTVTRRPWRACKRARAAVTVVLPWPEAGAAIINAGQADMFFAKKKSVVETGHRLDPGLEGMLFITDVADRIGSGAQRVGCRPTGNHHVLGRRAGRQRGQHGIEFEPAILEGIGQFVEHLPADCGVGQVVAGLRPGSLRGTRILFLVLAFPGKALAADVPTNSRLLAKESLLAGIRAPLDELDHGHLQSVPE